MKKFMIGVHLILLFVFPLQAWAGAPLDTVQNHVDHVLEVLRDPNLKAESAKVAQKRKSNPWQAICLTSRSFQN